MTGILGTVTVVQILYADSSSTLTGNSLPEKAFFSKLYVDNKSKIES